MKGNLKKNFQNAFIMKQLYTIFLGLTLLPLQAQSSYTAANYAAIGDAFYFTSANNLALDFETTGTNYNWDFGTLTGTSQSQLVYRNPSTTGFFWAFLFNTANTNLSSTDNASRSLNAFGQFIGITSSNDYFKKSTTDLKQVGSAYKIDYNGLQVPVTNQYTDPDVIYHFPLQYSNADSDNAAFTINISGLLYQDTTMERGNFVDGWGSLITPYGTFANVLRVQTNLIQNDTIAVAGNGLPRSIRTTREFKWFDPSKKQPVMTVTQSNTAGIWTTTNVVYLDDQRDFQTTALFAYSPLNPIAGATVYFQNLSQNATTYSWDFNDPSSGASNTSTDEFPTHVFAADGVYQVQLTASNGTYTNTVTIPVVIGMLGTNQFLADNNVVLYPNPFHSQIKSNYKDQDVRYTVINSLGQMIYQGANMEQHDFSNLTSGIYVVLVRKDQKVLQYKMVKN